jgi:PAS domain-containing protein
LPLQASGAALLFEGQIQTTGQVPGTDEIRALADWLLPRLEDGFYATANLAAEAPLFASLTGVASGVIATRVSGAGEEMLIWFREERVRTITWGGNPNKTPTSSDDPSELSPRRSFAQWHQIVEGTSDPWTPTHIAAARMIGASVTDVILQFRAVQIVIATDQLDQVSRQVQASELQVVVADASGAILESNAAFEAMIGARAGAIARIDDLPRYFADPAGFELRLEALRISKRGWRGEIALRANNRTGRPLHVRADAVTTADDRTLGFVLMFTDLTDRRAVELARRRFQDSIINSHRRLSARLRTSTDLKAQTLISHVVENAQLAALEVTDAADHDKMRLLLDGIRSSVERSAEVLERLSFDPPEDKAPPEPKS